MERSLVSTGTMADDRAARLRATMERFFPEAMVTGYEPLIAAMQNDMKDQRCSEQAVNLQNPPVTFEELLDRLAQAVPDLVAAVREYLVTGDARDDSDHRSDATCSGVLASVRGIEVLKQGDDDYASGLYLPAATARHLGGLDRRQADHRRYTGRD